MVYYGGEPPPEFTPSIQLDVDTPPHRAVEILATNGYRRIAMAVLETTRFDTMHAPHFRHLEFSYNAAIRDRGLKFREIMALKLDDVASLVAKLSPKNSPAVPDAIFLSDDFLSDMTAAAIRKVGLQPGVDFGLVTINHRGGHPLPSGINWSTFEFDTDQYGEIVVGRIVAMIQTAGTRPLNLSVQPLWKPGESHGRTAADPAV